MRGFSWIIDDKLAGLPFPGMGAALERDLEDLRDAGIRLLVTLTERPLDPQILARYDITSLHIPVQDFTPPSLDQMQHFVEHARFSLSQSEPVGVHCQAGIGRTGTMLAAYLISEGMDAGEAITTIRTLRPSSIETSAQEAALAEFQSRISQQEQ